MAARSPSAIVVMLWCLATDGSNHGMPALSHNWRSCQVPTCPRNASRAWAMRSR